MSEQHKEISIKDVLFRLKEWYRYLYGKWKIILLFTLIGACFGYIYSIIRKPVYIANLTFALEEKQTNSSSLGNIASQFGLSLGGSESGAFTGDNLIELFKSRYIIEKTLLTEIDANGSRELLINHYIKFNELDLKWAQSPQLIALKFTDDNRDNFSKEQDSVLGSIYTDIISNMLSVNKIDKKSSIVNVQVSCFNEIFAKLFVENIVKNVSAFYVETKTSKSRANINILEYRVDSVRKELDAAMYGRAQFSDQNMGLVRQSAAVPKVKQEMKVQMLTTMYTELIKNLEFSKLALMREEPLIQVIDKPILPLKKNRLSKLNGLILGGIIMATITILYLILNKTIKNILVNN